MEESRKGTGQRGDVLAWHDVSLSDEARHGGPPRSHDQAHGYARALGRQRVRRVRRGGPAGDQQPSPAPPGQAARPFCAAERWPLAVALAHFGDWSQLGVTKSAATDVYPDTATLSFRTVRYSSTQLTLRTTELTDNAGHALQGPTSLDRQLIGQYDVPPYVNSADQSGAVPFLDIGNRYVLAGAQYDPQVLAGLSAAQIAAQLRNPSSPVAQAIDGSAQVIVAAINQVLHDQAVRG